MVKKKKKGCNENEVINLFCNENKVINLFCFLYVTSLKQKIRQDFTA